MDALELLARDDKWYLGCGDGILFAPPFPVWLDSPGYWDDAQIYQYALGPLFTVAALDEDGFEIPMKAVTRRWTPAELVVEYRLANGVTASEVRTVHPGGIFASEWRLRAMRGGTMHLVAWTAQDGATIDMGSVSWDGELRFVRTVRDRRDVPLAVMAELACGGGATSWSASLSERSANHPHWRLAPFAEQWGPTGLPRAVRLEGLNAEGLMYAALHKEVPLGVEGSSATFVMRLSPADRTWARAEHPSSAAVADAPRPTAHHAATLGGASRHRWSDFFARVPQFRCSDPYFATWYWYRWYGLFLNAIAPGVGNYADPTVCEGIGFFHEPISYSAQCHARELRWIGDHEMARGVIRTFFRHQKEDGGVHGRIYMNHLEGTDFYHANWGDAVLALDAIRPDDAFLAEMYPALARFAEWLARTRDREGSGMIDVVDQFETGQEYMSRYEAVDPHADSYGWENRIRLKGIDVTVYGYALYRALWRICARAGHAHEEDKWRTLAERTADAVRRTMWNPATGMFSDVNPANGRRTDVKAAVCFYPYFTDLATADHLAGLERNLLDTRRFWTRFPVPSSALDDLRFSAEAEWKGKRHNCPWNGRVWPMTNSHIIEALGRVSRHHAPHLRPVTAELLRRFVRMMFHDGDLKRANCFEHYNPLTGHASVYRGIDDYQHSWVNDLIIQYVMGIRPHANGITVDPFPFELEQAEITGVNIRGATLGVRIEGEAMTVTVNGDARAGRLGTAMEFAT